MMSSPVVRFAPDNVPAELRELKQWIPWAATPKGEGKFEKRPIDPISGYGASKTNPADWHSFEAVAGVVGKRYLGAGTKAEGAGLALTDDDPLCAADLDSCRNPETGEVRGWAWEVVRALDSYTEVSPSGTGVRVWFRAELPGRGGPKTLTSGHRVELYDRKAFVTVTGHHLEGTPTEVLDRQEALDALLSDEEFEGTDGGTKPLPEKLTEGSREPTLFSIAGTLHRRGLSTEEITATLLTLNAKRCDPPHPEEYVREIAEKVSRRGYEAGSLTAGVTRTDTTDTTDTTAGGTMPRVLPPAVPFPVDALPEIPRRLVREGALTTGTTSDMMASMVLSALGSAVGTTRRLRLTNKWKEFPAVWTCVVSLSGDKKSPALDSAMEPIYEEQSRLFDEWERKKEEYKQDFAIWQERKKTAKGKDGGKDPGPKPEEPRLGQVFVQDITIEQLGEVLVDTPRGVVAIWDELSGFFTSADQYKGRVPRSV